MRRAGVFDRPSARSPRRETDELDVPFAAVPGVKRARGTRRRPRRDATGQTAEALEARPRASADSRAADERARDARAPLAMRDVHSDMVRAHGEAQPVSRVVARGSGQSAHETPTRRVRSSALYFIGAVARVRGKPGGLFWSHSTRPRRRRFVRRRHEFPRFRRSALRTARRRGDPTMAKKKKKSPATGKKSKHRFSHAQREGPAEKPSVFEARSGRLKFDILGRKTRGVKGDALKARAAGTAKRRNTLLKEHDASGEGQRVRGPPVRGG